MQQTRLAIANRAPDLALKGKRLPAAIFKPLVKHRNSHATPTVIGPHAHRMRLTQGASLAQAPQAGLDSERREGGIATGARPGVRPEDGAAAPGAGGTACRWQATIRPEPSPTSGGISLLHRSMA